MKIFLPLFLDLINKTCWSLKIFGIFLSQYKMQKKAQKNDDVITARPSMFRFLVITSLCNNYMIFIVVNHGIFSCYPQRI